MKLSISWPPKELLSNSRAHWAAKGRAAKKYRTEAAATAWAEGWHLQSITGPVAMTVTFCPPDMRRRDQHNMPHAVKSALDGLQDALGVDDNLFRVSWAWGDVVRGGAVRIEVRP